MPFWAQLCGGQKTAPQLSTSIEFHKVTGNYSLEMVHKIGLQTPARDPSFSVVDCASNDRPTKSSNSRTPTKGSDVKVNVA